MLLVTQVDVACMGLEKHSKRQLLSTPTAGREISSEDETLTAEHRALHQCMKRQNEESDKTD